MSSTPPPITWTGETRMLRACRRQPVDCTPVWFMRQAGRCLPEYRKLRERYDLLTMARTPDLAAEVTLMPVRAFGVDAAVIFADIMLPLEGMGLAFHIEPETGPIVHRPVRTMADVEALRVPAVDELVPYLMEAIRLVRRELAGKTAVIGFAGAPFTLACYMVEGKPTREYAKVKTLMFSQPAVWDALLAKVSTVLQSYVAAQVRAGAQVVQIFDSWVGALHPADYEAFVLPHTRPIFGRLAELDVPSVHFGTATGGLVERLARAGGDLIGLDWRVALDEGWARVGSDRGVQGNLDPVRLLAGWEATREGMADVLRRADGRLGHVFNLGHGVLPETPPDALRRLVDEVHAATAGVGGRG
ncbi:MAG: uroporphyrinogen decarboxylase, partial [Chloroflexi bacterium]|nr:uroporphyrinogen decarboxylase [Chloroflexota bacterium]